MSLRSIILSTLLCFQLDIAFAQTDLRYSGFISQSIVESKDNVVSDQGLKSSSAGLFLSYSIFDHLNIRSWIKYEPAFDDNTPLAIETALIDFDWSILNDKVGVRYGRLLLPYGFYGSSRTNPSTLPFITPPKTIIWPYNRALYDTLDGYEIYWSGGFKSIDYTLQVGRGDHKNPQPSENYDRGHVGISSTNVSTEFKHLEINWDYLSLRYDQLTPSQTYNITDENWTQEFGLPVETSPLWKTGKVDQNYDLHYRGAQYWFDELSFTYEWVTWYYLGNGSDQEYYNAISNIAQMLMPESDLVNSKSVKARIDMRNVIIAYNPSTNLQTFACHGWHSKGDPLDDGENRGTESCIGFKYKLPNILTILTSKNENWHLKGQYDSIDNTKHIDLSVNSDRSNWSTKWEIYSLQLVYDFN